MADPPGQVHAVLSITWLAKWLVRAPRSIFSIVAELLSLLGSQIGPQRNAISVRLTVDVVPHFGGLGCLHLYEKTTPARILGSVKTKTSM